MRAAQRNLRRGAAVLPERVGIVQLVLFLLLSGWAAVFAPENLKGGLKANGAVVSRWQIPTDGGAMEAKAAKMHLASLCRQVIDTVPDKGKNRRAV